MPHPEDDKAVATEEDWEADNREQAAQMCSACLLIRIQELLMATI